MARDVFISYSRTDGMFVDALIALLNQRGVPVWRDTVSLPMGVQWRKHVTAAIRGADLVVICESERWRRSRVCHDEADLARFYHRPIIRIPADPSGLTWAADEIARTFRQTSPVDRLTADIETLAAEWSEKGRKGKGLAHGRELRQYRSAFRHGRNPISETATMYLNRSIQRGRMRSLMAVLTVVAVTFALMMGYTSLMLNRTLRETYRSVETTMQVSFAVQDSLRENPYRALKTALDASRQAEDGQRADIMANLQTALAANVPISYGTAADADAGGFDFSTQAGLRAASPDGAYTVEADAGRSRVSVVVGGGTAGATNEIRLPSAPISLAASPDGLYVAVLTKAGVVLLDPLHGETVSTLVGVYCSQASNVVWSADGNRLAVDCGNGSIAVWDVHPDLRVVAHSGLWVMGVAALHDGTVALLSRDGRIGVVDVDTGRTRIVDALPTGSTAFAIASSADGTVYALAYTDDGPSMFRVDVGRGVATQVPLPDSCSPTAVATSPEGGDELAVGCYDGLIIVDGTSGDVRSRIDTDGLNITAVSMGTDGRLYVGAGLQLIGVVEQGGTAVDYDFPTTSSGGQIGVCPAGTVNAVAGGNGTALTVGDGTVAKNCSRGMVLRDGTWRMRVGLASYAVDSQANESRAVTINPDGTVYAVGLSDGTIVQLRDSDLQIGKSWKVPGEIRGLVFPDTDGGSVIAATRDGLVVEVPMTPQWFERSGLESEASDALDRAAGLGLYQAKD